MGMATNAMSSCTLPNYASNLNLSKVSRLSSLNANFSGTIPLRISAPKSVCSYKPVKAVMMAKREEELKEIRTKITEEINDEVIDLKGELVMLRIKKATRQELKSSEFGRMRKKIARMLTVRREREIEQGIKKRLSRKMDRAWKRSIIARPPPSLLKLQEEKAAKAAKEVKAGS
uniref:Large ribosomal subunit protein uL29c n=1 Tax=Picea sitchensis TaxID=3332 RepID=A9NQN1_PICSI|nr:unknown [Picea sitchensis]ABK23969.1 unknown [Picea sitchensis]